MALSLSLGMATLAPATPAVAAPREKVILDADMVDLFDDSGAMMMLADSPKVELKGVSIVIGNTWVETGTLEGANLLAAGCVQQGAHDAKGLCKFGKSH